MSGRRYILEVSLRLRSWRDGKEMGAGSDPAEELRVAFCVWVTERGVDEEERALWRERKRRDGVFWRRDTQVVGGRRAVGLWITSSVRDGSGPSGLKGMLVLIKARRSTEWFGNDDPSA